MGNLETKIEGEIIREIDVLKDVTSALNKKMDILVSRLGPISCTNFEENIADERLLDTKTILGGELQKQNYSLSCLLSKIERALSTLEI